MGKIFSPNAIYFELGEHVKPEKENKLAELWKQIHWSVY